MPWAAYAGPRSDEARTVALEIARALEATPFPRWSPEDDALVDPTFASGTCGIALCLALALEHGAGDSALSALHRYCDASVTALRQQKLAPSLFRGVTGIAWTLDQLYPILLREGRIAERPSLAAVDGAVHGWLQHSSWRSNGELIYGAAGIGVYCLSRVPDPRMSDALALILGHLESGAVREPAGMRLSAAAESHGALGVQVNLGHAHGVSGIIAFLAELCARHVHAERAASLLEASVSWLLAQALPAGTGSVFPAVLHPAQPPEASQLGWCYGDLGVALALHRAGDVLHRTAWRVQARDIALHASRRDVTATRAGHLSVCHGLAGVAHLFNRLGVTLDAPECCVAARRWLAHLLDARTPGHGFAGYRLPDAELDIPQPTGRTLGLLTGAAGVALGLFSAVSDTDHAWDVPLLARA